MTELKKTLKTLGIDTGLMQVIESLKSSDMISVSKVYQFTLSMEEKVLSYFSEIRESELIKNDTELRDVINDILENEKTKFYEMLNKLKKATEEGKGDKPCRDIFYPPAYVV